MNKRASRLMLRTVAFVMAVLLAVLGVVNDGALSFTNAAGTVTAKAATTGTVNADTFSWDNASVYFLLTDRFRNGNTSNDHSYNRGLDQNGNVVTGIDDRGLFHGGDFAGITQSIEEGYFDDLGVNALWISAPYEQIHGYIIGGDGNPSFAHYSYHGYYVLDYTNTDANFGTAAEFQTLVDTAHEHGIRVIIDVVLNHAGYNSLYDMAEYGFGDVNAGWESYYYAHQNVNNADYHSYINYEGSAADWGRWWGPSWVRAGLPGYTEGGGDSYTMSLAGLPDFLTESAATVTIPTFLAEKWQKEGRYDAEVAELKNYLSKNGYAMTVTNCISYWLSCWVREFGVDGFRCDTAKHVEFSSWKTMKTMCTEALRTWKANNPDKALDNLDFWMTGECWDHTVSYDGYYTQADFDSMINFETTGGGALAAGTIADKYAYYASAINTNPDFNVLSYISSHDSTLARGDMIYLGSAFLLLPGGIQIFYGDETNRELVDGIPFDGYGGAGHSLRSDMNWDSMDEDVLTHWQRVGSFRNNHIAVGAGANAQIDATSGYAFTRTYSSGDIKDRVAFCIAAGSNKSVTLDVSSIWNDGDTVVNYYDSTSAVVTDGKVTFNSGANGTILIQDPDGKPLVSFEGAAKFEDTQQITVHLQDTDSAIVSVDGAKKFVVQDGDTFTIGANAYEGDTVAVTYTATNDKGTVNGKVTYYKAYKGELDDDDDEEPAEESIVHVKMADGSAPYLYAWEGASTALAGAWPGTKMTQLGDDGYYYYKLDTTGTYNVIFNNGSAKTGDLTNISGEVWFDVSSDFGNVTITGNDTEPINNTVTIYVKPYASAAPFLYVWDNAGNTYNGGFPGKQLTEKTNDGWYVFTQDGVESLNCIVGDGGSTNRTGDITGITGEAWITMTSADNTKYDIEKTIAAESSWEKMKKAARAIKNLEQSDYTTASWNAVYAYVEKADALVELGEEAADPAEVEATYNALVSGKAALVIAAPVVTSAKVGSKVISGTAAYGSTVTVTVNNKTYTAQADEYTCAWSVTVSSSLSNGTTIYAKATRDGSASSQAAYTVGSIIETSTETETETDPGDDVTVKPVTGFTATYQSGSIVLTWDNTGATGYMIARSDGRSGYTYLTYSATSGSWIDTDIITGQLYYYRIRPYIKTADGTIINGELSDAVAVVATDKVPDKVTGVTATVSNGKVVLNWDAADGARYYKISRASGATGKYYSVTYNLLNTTYTDSVSKGTYRYKVVGYYKDTDGGWVYGELCDTVYVTVK